MEKKLNELGDNYKYLAIEEKEKALRYVDDTKVVENFVGKNNDIYYYAVVNRGFFKSKEVYLINPYTKQIYKVEDNSVNKI